MSPNAHPLDDDSASRLLQGIVHPDDAPPGYAAVASVLNSAARLPLAPVDEDAATANVTAMVEVIRTAGPAPQPSRRKTMLGKLLAGKALAAIAVVGLTATGAAAATGSLPDPAQDVVSGVVSHVGVNIPHPNHGKSADHRQDGQDDHGQPGDNGQAGNNGQQTSTDAHDAKAGVEDGGKVGPAVCAAVSDGKCQAGQHGGGSEDQSTPPGDDQGAGQENGDDHGKPEVTPPTTPTTGSIETGEDHSTHEELPSSSETGKGKSGRND